MAGLDHAPPPFFKRGPAPLALLTFYVAISLGLFILDLRFHSADMLRQVVAMAVDPLQRVAQTPGAALGEFGSYFQGIADLKQENTRLLRAQLDTSPNLARLAQLESENARLRRLLDMKVREQAKGQIAQILYKARDPFSKRIVVDRGQQTGIAPGSPVIDDTGVVGQVTRVHALSSEITLITDKDQVVPVQIVRTGQRSVVYGLGDGRMDLRYLPANADVQEGDLIVTSGLDGIYLPGFPVAKVSQIERNSAYSFARIICTPVAGVESFGEVVILNQRESLPAAPATLDRPSSGPADDAAGARPKHGKRATLAR